MKTCAKPGLSLKRAAPRAQSPAITGESGKPSSAYLIAGASTRASGSFPYFACSCTQPSTAPGTLHENGE
jgi:hypothetical protein